MRTLRVYLAILVLGAMLPGTLLTAILVWRAFTSTRAGSERRLLEAARVDAAALDREFAGAINVLESLATSPALDRNDLEAFHAEGRRVQATQPGWSTIVLLSPDERQLASTQLDWGTPLMPVTEPDSLRRLVETGRPTVGAIRQSPRGGPERLFAIRVPVLRNGQLKFALSAIVNVTSLGRVVPKTPGSSDEWTRTILDSEGTIAVRTRGASDYVGTRATDAFRERIRRAPESVTAEVTREGVTVYAATGRNAYGWTTVIVVPRAVLDGPVNASMAALVTGGVLLMLCGLVAVVFVSRRLSSDLSAATAAAEAVAEGRPIGDGGGHVIETRKLQRSLVAAASLLEQHARERDEQLRRAERANQVKDQFLAVLGHELRNPLAPALTALELMRVRNPEGSRREREVLERQIAHMTRLVNDLLDVSRLARGKTELVRKRFDVREAVERAIDMVQPLVVQKRHTLSVDIPAGGLVVDGDIDRIVQVLSNLLTNAAKYTPADGRLSVSAAAVNDQVRIACEDNGPGIAPELVPTLFNDFAQGPRALDRREGGLGLGLALARSFTELHGGTIAFEPATAGGSRFIVTLPLVHDVADSLANPDVTARLVNGASRRILVVDDNDDAAEMLRIALADAGHVVATAASGPDALRVAADFRPDVGVLDIGLPGIDGYELARRLRETNATIRLVALTGYGQDADVEAATRAGFDAHFAKPVPIASLLEALTGASRQHSRLNVGG
jgi:signal transduction histidine kinase/ActR/RegA family two-component response regulator